MKLVEYADSEMMAMALADMMASELRAALRQRDRVLLVVPGGTTPGPVFDDLCGARLEWERVDVLPSDERWRPEAHIRSNARLIRERLLVEEAASARLLPMYARDRTPEDAVGDLAEAMGASLPISVLLLGMGADMHTASLFPRADNLALALEPGAPVLVPLNVAGEPEPRVSLSARVLNDAMSKHLIIIGDAKKAALERARGQSPEVAPVAAVMDDLTVHWAPE
ncbi:6-phosphogluconolactonase [Pseudohalocynthiibacter aestuariivivens]|uniref:6-phosphogluconolactonase n=1 Tax=Roseovarius pelagicus TaxID=2980108 RepID=A0ABY6DB16_9RHOB|nr:MULTISPECIES: 6-phosphogluconolactonase [Rhodobacterales]QIE44734.1 6-phosphogluconolactonase [Pseudohalocynthiibacter aestuariivivens]UXX83354.1 6-phosphogluconolactonase [Roseovarius pelagicus]